MLLTHKVKTGAHVEWETSYFQYANGFPYEISIKLWITYLTSLGPGCG